MTESDTHLQIARDNGHVTVTVTHKGRVRMSMDAPEELWENPGPTPVSVRPANNRNEEER